jgi:hypothetical protein
MPNEREEMALISCSECRKEISSSASACPGCGAPVQNSSQAAIERVAPTSKTRPVFKILGVILLGLFGLALIGKSHTPVSVDSTPAPTTEVETAPSNPVPSAPELTVSSAKLAEDYEANEVSADMKYKGKRLQMSGMVVSVNKDIVDAVWVGIEGGSNPFMPIHAEGLDPTRAAGLKKGQMLSLTCTGAGMIIGSPILSHCE